MDAFTGVAAALLEAGVRFVVIGVAGANYYALSRQTLFATQDRDLFLPPDPENELSAWHVCRDCGLDLTVNEEPLGEPLDLWLAERVVARRATVRCYGPTGLQIDLSLSMAGFEFDQVWPARTVFVVDGIEIPVASLDQIVALKRAAGRAKDLLFLREHREVLETLLTKRQL